MKLTKQNNANRKAYQAASAKQFGTLHERMKYVIELLQRNPGIVPHSLDTAIYDLETEVSYHEPQTPPCGRRTGN